MTPTVLPGVGWNGTAGSGFLSPPADPTRTTAKPAMRVIVAPNQAFTDELLVGVYAGANNGGSLMENMGLEKVTVHYEGTSLDIPAPSFETIVDANGTERTYYGWWAKLGHNGTNGQSNLYFEAVPKDATMQNRVTGPFAFLPSAALYDFDVTIDPDSPQVTDVNYQTLAAAISRFAAAARDRGRARIVKAGVYDMLASGGPGYTASKGWFEISASVPSTIAKTAETKNQARPGIDRVRFRGANLTLDMRYISEFRPHSTGAGGFWFDGCNIINSGGRNELWNKTFRPISWISRNLPWFTECPISGILNATVGAALVRGCVVTSGASDVVTGSNCVLATTFSDWDSTFYKTQVPALTVQYVGAGATATLSISGTLSSTTRTWTAKVDGASVGTYVVQNTDPTLATYNVSGVVVWLNTLTGFTATLLDDTRRATNCGPPGVVGTAGSTMTDQDVKTAPWTGITIFDFHADWWQKDISLVVENVVVADNAVVRIKESANIFINGLALQDGLFLNNAFDNFEPLSKSSQLISPLSHVVVAHNSGTQLFHLRATLDAYTLVANNVAYSWGDFRAGDQTKIVNNHLMAGASAADVAYGTGTTQGGDVATLFPSATSGNFTPAGALLSNQKPSVVEYDLTGERRTAFAPVGAQIITGSYQMASARRLQELSVPGVLAVELARQSVAKAGNEKRLMELGMAPLLAREVAARMTGGTISGPKLVELGMVPNVAVELKAQILADRV